MTWQEAARGIPVWEGCLATDGDGDSWRILEADNHDYVARIRHPWCGNVHEGCHPDLIPDLADPDTHAMYLRRLAVALGHDDADGASFGNVGGMWWITGGIGDGTWIDRVGLAHVEDRLEALALAWPADKRVAE